MTVSLWIPTAGDIRFLDLLWESFQKHTQKAQCPVTLLLDLPVVRNHLRLERWCAARAVNIRTDDSNRGLNHLWARCVEEADTDTDIVIVANDDIYLPPTWLNAILAVFSLNPQIALVGIPANGEWHDQNRAKERWFGDPTLFESDHIWKLEKAISYEPWTAGMLWAARRKEWLESLCAELMRRLYWGYGEPVMARKLFEAGHFTASIYRPTLWHYGGGAYWLSAGRNARYAGDDGKTFADMYGTGHLHLLLEPWKQEILAKNPPKIEYTPTGPP